MATLTGKQLKDSYQGLLTIKTADDANPLSGRLENGLGNAITNLGIGTDSPSAKLMIETGGDEGIRIYRSGSNANFGAIEFRNTTDTATNGRIGWNVNELRQEATSTISFHSNSTERMRIDSSGQVHINGTTSVTTAMSGDNIAPKLIVEDDLATGIGILRQDTSIASSNSLGSFGFYGTDTTSNTPTPLASMQAIASGTHSAGNNPTELRFFVTPSGSSTMNEAVRIDSSGNVGIGTNDPTRSLTVYSDVGATNILGVFDNSGTSASNCVIAFSDPGSTAGQFSTRLGSVGDALAFYTNGANERLRIDSSGNVLVGKTASNYSSEGIELRPTELLVTKDSGTVLSLQRLTDDGTIISFAQGGSTVGSIGNNGSDLFIASQNAGLRFRGGLSQDRIVPVDDSGSGLDNSVDLGDSGTRFENLYLGGNVILSSGSGIDFSDTADGSGTMTSELLDDYEEGTWTPVYIPETGSFTTMTMDVQSATYTKVGRQVTVRAYIRTDNVDTTGASGKLRVDGLPFTSSASQGGKSAISVAFLFSWGTAPDSGYIEQDSTYIQLQKSSAGNYSQVSDLTTGATSNQNQLILTATYFV